ncbi:mannose-1-phosphate guanylyltransferase [Aeromicrobium sp. IC_218]|uniref:mannose-1-phosphate guanylyltransferase n=1 Tax=Aeromicrobium sp. IC_218 TaxID=2545468 RepID=UPI00103FC55B|nr:mannose-1-phosphate guanylyltransferase [Aeromicrobium sp. IC_218]TCI99114.1 mannose-1-phosphate guanylyltransferase [Aeromicrobium sp. IC_218]
MTLESFHAVIPAGGAGTRLWPLSRTTRPKFLLDLTGSGRSLLQQTWDRLTTFVEPDHVHVVTGAKHADAIREQLPELTHLVIEPEGRDSMPAIGVAAALIHRTDPGAVVGSFAADHLIQDVVTFARTVAEADAVARTGKVVTIGIEPTGPSTAFGYIEAGDPLGMDEAPHALDVVGFVEKPDAETAAAYLATGRYRWNAGMFVTRTDVLLDHLAEQKPDLRAGLDRLADDYDGTLDAAAWGALEKVAIDHAIAEPVAAAGGVAVVPGEFDWFDIGDFAALASLPRPETSALAVGSEDALVLADPGKAVTVLGIPGAVVVDTGDALLVTTAEHAQAVKQLPGAWAERGRPDLV